MRPSLPPLNFPINRLGHNNVGQFVLRVVGDANGGGVTGDAHLVAPPEKRVAAIYFSA
jgi:hypothetical protein